MKELDVLKIFEETGALLSGHFLLSSGLHSDRYLQAARILQYPQEALLLGRELAQRFSGQKISAVIGPALGAVVIAFTVSAGLKGTRAIFAEREGGVFTLRRGFEIKPAERVLVVEDVITTGGSTREIITLAKNLQAEVIGVGAVAERSTTPISFDVPKEVLLRLPLNAYSPESCSLCQQGIPLVKPGSRR
ncbi:MAG: orotate phosphoribosyltransferase [bacterium (Candidatus Ratteibacteria) CG23_combo_of_CG06-09_8_20_14_all_48_7]|uniref:Orotate phosphoribosyltransferase n=1 Tax=bacterium (Candidatus Ratteibacteria) CG23_combo_of_CG06-09_8_20_14_all_48_7 TaxID=2014292 RepID=A0A2G9Y9Y2_9BACT|nr:MAG: orotate phosphoribosyltransferase [bacterium (Candidatus Ratteibacteria) CG23_combo_of_CG06-09_8_20_14_all_48_7]